LPQQPRYPIAFCLARQSCNVYALDDVYNCIDKFCDSRKVVLFFRKWVQAIHYLYLLQFLQDTHKDSRADDTYMSTILATSPPPDILTTIPVVPRLHAEPRIMPARVSSLSKVLVSLH
jgi:hypothetical protein